MLWKKSEPVREAKRKDLERITQLRRQLHEMYMTGRFDFFQKPFGDELAQETRGMLRDRQSLLLVCEEDGTVCGYLHAVFVTESATVYRDSRSYCSGLGGPRAGAGRGRGVVRAARARDRARLPEDRAAKLGMQRCRAGVLAKAGFQHLCAVYGMEGGVIRNGNGHDCDSGI